jgi:acyl-CoA hydrolase
MPSPPNGGTEARAIFAHIDAGADVIVPMANGEPVGLLDMLEAEHERLSGVRVHQMHALHRRRYIEGAYPGHLRHVSYFLSPATRAAYWAGGCDLVPNHFSEMPHLLRTETRCSIVLAAASPPDRHGYFSLGTNADYVAPLIGKVPFFLEVNRQMPRTQGLNQLHVSQVLGWTEVDRPLVEVPAAKPDDRDRAIARSIVELIPDGATLQVGIGSIPNAVLSGLADHRDLGIHTELLSDGIVELVEHGVVTGTRKKLRPNKIVTTFALGSQRLYDWLHNNTAVELRRRSTSTASAPRRRSPGATGPRAAARRTSRAARCTPRGARRSSCCTRRRAAATAASACTSHRGRLSPRSRTRSTMWSPSGASRSCAVARSPRAPAR